MVVGSSGGDATPILGETEVDSYEGNGGDEAVTGSDLVDGGEECAVHAIEFSASDGGGSSFVSSGALITILSSTSANSANISDPDYISGHGVGGAGGPIVPNSGSQGQPSGNVSTILEFLH